MTKISELHRRWSKDPEYKDTYDALGEEFDLASDALERFAQATRTRLRIVFEPQATS
jgi:hypothetical protein